MYTKSIVIFGIAIPGALLLIAILVMMSYVKGLKAKSLEKEEAFTNYEMAVNARKSVEKKLAMRTGQMEYWDENLQLGFVQVMNDHVTSIMERMKPEQLRLVEIGRGGMVSLSKDTKASSSAIMLTFEGGYGPMQFLMGEIETLIPQLEMERLDIGPGRPTGRGSSKELQFKVLYSAWSK